MNNIKPYTKYKSSGIEWMGDIPDHWELRKLKTVIDVFGRIGFRGYTTEDIVSEGNGAISLSPSNIKEQQISYLKSTFISFEKYYESPEIIIEENDVILVKTASVGKAAYIQNLKEKATINPQLVVFKNYRIHRKYFYYQIISTVIQNQINGDLTGGVMNTITQNKIMNYYINIPLDLFEQTTIANFLDYKTTKIERFIRKKKQLIKLLNEQKAGIINDAVTKGLDANVKMKSSGIEWLGDIPEHWEVRKLKYVADCFPSNIDKHSRENEEQVRLCNYTDVYKNDYIINDMSLMIATASNDQISKFSLLKDDVIITKDSETADDIANPALVIEDLENVVCGYHLSVLRPEKNLFGAYLFRTLQVKAINIQFEIHSNGVTRVGLGVYDLKNAEIPVPPLTEQQQIVSHIETETAKLNKAIATTEKEIALVQEYKTALIAEAVTGKIDVRDYVVPVYEEETEMEEEAEEELDIAAEEEADYNKQEME